MTVSCIQACILLLYNEQPAFKFKEIREALGVTEEMLKFSIVPLVYSKMRILFNKGVGGKGKPKEEANKITSESIQPDDLIVLVPLKTGGRLKVQYPPGHAAMLQGERDKEMKKTMEDRVLKIELALVRVMKARNTLKQQQLIAESTKQLIKFFKPDPRLMKKRIENLMERGFMRRDEEDQTLIHYQA